MGRRGRARRRARGARVPVEPARSGSGARQPGRRQHLVEGNRRRPRRPRAARALGQGLRHRPRLDHRGRLPGAAPGRGAAAARTRVDGRRGDGRVPAPLRAHAEPAAPVDRDAAARVHPGGARRPHAPGRDHRADVVARRAPPRRGGVRRRSGLARLPASRLRHVEAHRGAARRESVRARGAAREARSRHVGRHPGAELPRHDRVRHARRARARRRGRGRVRSGRQQDRGARGDRCGRAARACAPGAPRRVARGRGRRRARDRPQPRGDRLRLVRRAGPR